MIINGSAITKKTASCPDYGDWAIRNGLKVSWSNKKIGDVVLFDFNKNGTSDHIGIVYRINGNKIYTIEGNTSSGSNTNGGQVQLRTRTKSQINYFVRPKFSDKFTKEMLIAAALVEVGIKESPKNSNRVKYNRFFFGSDASAQWCATFVYYCFAHMISYPTGTYYDVIQTSNIKYGSKSTSVKKWQRFLTWYFSASDIKADGEFGGVTKRYTMAFQALERLEIDGSVGKLTRAAARKYLPQKTADNLELADKIVTEAKRLAWDSDTNSKIYKYATGKPTEAYKVALDKAYPNRSSWGAATKKGASCDVFIGTLIRILGIDLTFARGLGTTSQGQWHDFANSDKFQEIDPSNVKEGDFIIYTKKDGKGHVCVCIDDNVAEAGHKNYYPRIGGKTSTRINKSGKKKLKVYRAKTR